MSADEPLVTRLDGMINRAKEKKESLEYQVEDVAGTLSSLELAKRVAEAQVALIKAFPFELTFNIMGPPFESVELKLCCATGTSSMRTLLITMLEQYAKDLAQL